MVAIQPLISACFLLSLRHCIDNCHFELRLAITVSQHNFTVFFSLLIASRQLNTFVNTMPPSPATLQKLIATELSPTQLADAYGRYSQLKPDSMSYGTWLPKLGLVQMPPPTSSSSF
jgi:hypothetical protein